MGKSAIEICYVLLCHKNPDGIIKQIEYLVNSGAKVIYHMDKGAPKASHAKISNHFADNPSVATVASVKAGWGDWSLVKATLRMLNKALHCFPNVTHFYYLSGDCVPIRSAYELESFLAQNNIDVIETEDFFHSGWIKTGPHLQRIENFHFVNERKYKWLFYRIYDLHSLLGIKRKVPEGLNMSIGSQWWCLRRATIEHILDYLQLKQDVVPFFRWTWIPDEIFFQTLVATLVSARERVSIPPTFLKFSDYGLPIVFYNDHFDFLIQQNRFFARKISSSATLLNQKLVQRFLEKPANQEPISVDALGSKIGLNTLSFITHSGRHGLRFGETVWSKYARIDSDKQIILIVAKKWHIGYKVGDALSKITGVPFVGYYLDENSSRIPQMGGLEFHIKNRRLNNATFLRTVMELHNHNQVIACVDPARYNEIQELSRVCADLRIIEIDSEFGPDYLEGHAERIGLVGSQTLPEQREEIHRALLETLRYEAHRIRSLNVRVYEKMRLWYTPERRADLFANVFERDAKDFEDISKTLNIRE